MDNYHIFSEQELLKRLQSNDEQAFTEIYNRYWEKLLAIGFYFSHDKHVAEDIVHEVMMSLWIRKSDLDIQSLEAFLGTAVKFAVFKTISREKRRKELLAAHTSNTLVSDTEAKLDARFLQDYLNGVIEQLPEKAQLVFHYRRNEELSITEIAGKMDLSPKAVEYHLTKALKSLKATLGRIKMLFV